MGTAEPSASEESAPRLRESGRASTCSSTTEKSQVSATVKPASESGAVSSGALRNRAPDEASSPTR